MGTETPRLREWWYLKARKLPAGVMGRPRSTVPLAERRKATAVKYRAKLAGRGMVKVRLLLPTEAVARLRALAEARHCSSGEVVAELLQPAPIPPGVPLAP